MTTDRKRTLAAGVFYLVTFVAIPALIHIGPVLDDPNYIVSDGVDTRVLLGCVLDIVVALTCIGTAVALFPVLRRHNEASALGFVTTRMFEAGVILVGVASLIALVSLRQSIGGPDAADPAALVIAGQSLVAVRDVTFLLGPGVVPALNALILAPILYRNRLVPRILPIIGLIGAPLLLASSAATLFGANAQISGLSFLLGLPIACWELSLGIWMIIKGFNSAFPGGLRAIRQCVDWCNAPVSPARLTAPCEPLMPGRRSRSPPTRTRVRRRVPRRPRRPQLAPAACVLPGVPAARVRARLSRW